MVPIIDWRRYGRVHWRELWSTPSQSFSTKHQGKIGSSHSGIHQPPHEADIMQEITSHPIKPFHCCYCWKYWVNFSANNSLVSHLAPCAPEANTWYQVNFISSTVCLILHGGSHATIPLKMMWIHSLHRLESKDLIIALRVLPMLPFSLLYSHKWHCSCQ